MQLISKSIVYISIKLRLLIKTITHLFRFPNHTFNIYAIL